MPEKQLLGGFSVGAGPGKAVGQGDDSGGGGRGHVHLPRADMLQGPVLKEMAFREKGSGGWVGGG